MSRLKTLIDANIKENGNQEITGNVLNYVLTEIADEVKREGYFPDMSVGFADNLVGRGESTPAEFTFRASGGKSIKDGAARIKRIKGNSVVWNQQVDTITPQDCELSETDNRLTLTPQGGFPGVKNVVSMNIIENHVYICISNRIGGGFLNINCGGYDGDTNVPFRAKKRDYGFTLYAYGETQPFTITRPRLIDLTKMFQAGNEPSTIEEYEARKTIVEDEYAYNEGEVIHCNTESIKSVGDNAWDEQWELGIIVNGENYELEGYIRSKNYIPIIGGEDYHYANRDNNASDYLQMSFYDEHKVLIDGYARAIGTFPTPINARYMRFYINGTYGTTYKNDIMISLVHSGWKAEKDDQYQPYWEDTLPLSIIRKYFPQGMKSAGSAHDEIRFNKASGKWEGDVRFVEVDFGTLSWYYDASLGGFYSDILVGAKKLFHGICAKYPFVGDYRNVTDKTCGYVYESCVLVKDSSYTDAATFKAAMQGVILYYELAEPIVTEIEEPISTDYRVADFGTEQAQSSVPSAPFSADIIYQFNAVDMIRELWLKVQELEKRL